MNARPSNPVERRKAAEHYGDIAQQLQDAKDAARFRCLQKLPVVEAQAFFWNYESRKQRAAAIDERIAAEPLKTIGGR